MDIAAGIVASREAGGAVATVAIAERNRGTEQVKVTEGLFTFVALDENNRPRPVRPGTAEGQLGV